MQINGRSYVILGVAPKGFRGLTDKADIWVPSQIPPKPFYLTSRRLRWLHAVARLNPGVTVERAQAEMSRIASVLVKEYPDMNAGIGVRVTGLRDYWFGALRFGLLVLTAGACILLIIACIGAPTCSSRGRSPSNAPTRSGSLSAPTAAGCCASF